MKPLGQATLHTNYKGKHYKLRFQVVPLRHAQKPLLSANTCEHLTLLTCDYVRENRKPLKGKVSSIICQDSHLIVRDL